MALQAEDDISKAYPQFANWAKSIPEIWNILLWSVSGAHLSESQIEAAIQNTTYWKTHTEAQRTWDVAVATDPKQAEKSLAKYWNDTLLMGIRMGANLTIDQVHFIGQQAAINGWTPQELQDQIVGYTAKLPDGQRGGGDFGAAITKVRNIAADYAMPVTDDLAKSYAQRMLLGGNAPGADENGLRDIFAKQAASLYPTLAHAINSGTTVAQWAAPYKALAAQELEVSPDMIDLSDPKWRTMLEGTNAKDGSKQPMTLSEWQATIRQQSRYGYDRTTGARQQAAQMETELLKRFGGI